jgi:hypothetical protein
MRTPFKVSLVASCGVFFAALLSTLLRHDTINGHTLTPLEQLPTALVLAVIFSVLALLGTWLGLRGSSVQHLTYRAGLAVALLYIIATFLGNVTFQGEPQTVTFPSHEATVQGVEILLIGTLWGIGAPYAISLLVRRFRFLGTSNGA